MLSSEGRIQEWPEENKCEKNRPANREKLAEPLGK